LSLHGKKTGTRPDEPLGFYGSRLFLYLSLVHGFNNFLAGIQTSSSSSVQARERKAEKTEEKGNIVGTI